MTSDSLARALPRRIIFVDVETTGLAEDDRIVSLGAISVDGDQLARGSLRYDLRHLIFNPGRDSHPRAKAVHGYEDQVLRGQDKFDDHASAVSSFLGSAGMIVAHNAAFDLRFIEQELRRARLPAPAAERYCTMSAHKMSGRGGAASLAALSSQIGLRRSTEQHGAFEDAWFAMMIFLNQQGISVQADYPAEYHGPINLRPAADRADPSGISAISSKILAKEPPVRPVPGLISIGPISDADEADDAEDEVDIDGVTVGIRYLDSKGDMSTRTVRCHGLRLRNAVIYLDGECQLRQSWRSFRVDRIVDVFDYTTGEVLGDGASFFGAKVAASWSAGKPAKQAPSATTRLRPMQDGVKVLMYLAMEDGSLHTEEYKIILAYALRRLAEAGELDAGIQDEAAKWIRNFVPTKRAATIALGKLMDSPEHGSEVAQLMIDLIVSDGKTTDEEMAAAWALVKVMERREAGQTPLK